MRDQKYLRKAFHKYATWQVKDYANKIKKGVGKNVSSSSYMNPELKLENQASISSVLNDNNINGEGSNSNYDFDEGIRRYTQTIYGPVLSILNQQQQTQDLLEPLEKDKESERYLDDYKKHHEQAMQSWKMQAFQSRLRGGGVGHTGGQTTGTMMAGNINNLHVPQLRQHYSIQHQQ